MESSVGLSRKLNRSIKGVGYLLRASAGAEAVKLRVLFVAIDPKGATGEGDLGVYVAGKLYGAKSLRRRFRFPIIIRLITAYIPYSDIEDANIHNRISTVFVGKNETGFIKPVVYSFWKGLRGRGKSRALRVIDETDTTVYVRQSVRNRAYITQRRRNVSDDKRLLRKITLAYYLSLFLRWKKVILLYEKESLKYEESASILFEKLVDEGYKNVYFVLDSGSPHWQYVAEKYRSYIVPKHSLKHYVLFFIAKVFMGTEMPAHAIDLRVANKHAVRKIGSKTLRYVFLQHGVMYMVSLASEARRPARKGEGGVPKLTKTVVSSQLEAQHFVDHGGYDWNDLYVSGLPKFDRSKRKKDADKIVIMPTWRPWEYNAVRTHPEETRYYKMLEDMIAGVPVKLRDKVQLLPHPLFIRELSNSPLQKYIKPFVSYDEVLQETDVLITDYSSIAYDAFYRGAKVVFWWKEKDYCMEQYGGFLMLNEKNVFGDIAKGSRALKQAVAQNYREQQSTIYKRRFRKIVSFRDSKNTERLLEILRRDDLV